MTALDQRVEIPDSASLDITDAVTLEAWVSPAQFGEANNGTTFISKSNLTSLSNQPYGLLFDSSGQVLMRVGNSTTFQQSGLSSTVLPLNSFSHIVGTYDGATIKIYVNGVLENSQAASIGSLVVNNLPVVIGGNNLNGYLGKIDEPTIYNRALSASEIQAVFNAGQGGKCKPTATLAPNGQIAWFAGDGNANDTAGTNNGRLVGGASFAVDKVGQGFIFDGVDDAAEIPDAPSLNPTAQISFEAWVFPTATSGTPDVVSSILSKDAVAPFVPQFVFGRKNAVVCQSGGGISEGNFIFFLSGISGLPNECASFTDGGGNLPINTWTHVALTYDGSNIRAFINGVQTRQIAASGNLLTTSGTMHIGGRSDSDSSSKWQGRLDEVSLYNRGLTADEITSIFNAGIAGKLKQNATVDTNSLVSLYQGENSANDTRGANNGNLQGGTTFTAGKVGQSFGFDGTDDAVVTAPNAFNSGLAAITIEAFVNPSVHGTDSSGDFGSTIISNADIDGFALRLKNGVIQADLRLAGGNVLQTFGSTLPLNQWSHIALTYNGATVQAFLNGSQVGNNVPATGTIRNSANSGICLMIGNDPGMPCVATNDGFGFNGKIDEAAIYNRSLTAAEIRANYEAGNALSTIAGDARVSASTVPTAGTIQQIPLTDGLFPALPFGVPTGLIYDIASNVNLTNPTVCFNLPSFTPAQFADLRIYHLEAGAWQPRTAAANTYPTLCTTNLPSLSPFAIA